ncbi:MAG: DNA polymerase I [Actinomycetes bacterium]
MAPRPRLLLLDGHSLAYRAFYALPVENFSTTTGQPTNAVYGFTSMAINALRDEEPTHLAVAFDVSRTTFRTAEFPEYKANRLETPEPFKGQVSLIKEVLQALRIPWIAIDGYEADDVLATLATQAVDQGFDVAVITGDRDAFQLVSDHVTVLYPRKGVSDLARMTPSAVEEKYGLTPSQYPDYAALRGDPSDNLPGIPGVGEKTAAKWVREFGSLDDLVNHADEVKGKVGESLRANLSQVVTNRRLTELVRDVPLDVGPENLQREPWDRHGVDQVFDSLQFRVLRDRLYATLDSDEPVPVDIDAVEVDRLESQSLGDWLRSNAPAGARHALVVTGQWARGTGDVDAVAVAAASGAVCWFQPRLLDDVDATAWAEWLGDARVHKAIHDANGPWLAFAAHGWHLRGLTADPALAAYLVRPDQRSYELADLARRHLGRDLGDAASDGQLMLGGDPDAEAATAAGTQASAVRDLADVLDEAVEQHGGSQLLRDVELPLTGVLVAMEQVGIAADTDYLDGLRQQFADEVQRAAEEAYAVIGHEVNLGSPKQLQVVLFDELNLPKTKRIKTGYTTDAEALTSLFAQTENPFLEHLLRHRDVSKLLVTVEGLRRSVADDGRIHTTYNQTVAATGRLSSTDPNLQNIPIRTDEGRRIRAAFVVGPGFETLLTADYSQVEMRIMAHLSGDEALIEAFASGEDLHTTVASSVFQVAPEDVDPAMRSRIKAMSYGLAYGLSAYGLAQQLGIGPDEARALMDEYFARFGGVRDYLAGIVEEARRTGFTETVMGRRRYLPDLTSDNRQRREMAERMALNAPIQGSAADIIKVAMLNVDTALRDAGLRSRLLLQVHDELVLEVAPGEAEELEGLVRHHMREAYPLRAPLEVSVGFGKNWETAAH